MTRFRGVSRYFILLLALSQHHLLAQTGMVLQTHNTQQYGDGELVVVYLSTKQSKSLVSAGVYGPCFSPDGKQVACPFNRQKLTVMNVDGTGRKELCNICTTSGSKEPYCSWSTNGYIYWSQCDRNIYRIKADGTQKTAEIVFTSSKNIHNLEFDNAGNRCAWTKPPPDRNGNNGGWSNSILQLDQTPKTEIDFTGGCQIAIAPSGSMVTRSSGGHDQYYILKFGKTTDQSWASCENASCPNYIFYGPDPVTGARHYMIRWSRNDSSKILFTLEDSFDGYVYDWQAKSKPVRVGKGFAWDYFQTEIQDPGKAPALSLSPSDVIINLTQGGTADSAVVTVTAQNTTAALGDLAVTGAPAWLSVSQPAGATKRIVNKVNTTALTALGTFTAPITVADAGTGLRASYTVTLNYKAPTAAPIVISQSPAGASLKVGDSLKVAFDADCGQIPSVTVSLSLDSGETWVKINQGNSIPCGTSQRFSWKVTATVLDAGVTKQTVSQECKVRVQNYAGAGEAISGLFSIAPAGAARPPIAARQIGASLVLTQTARGSLEVRSAQDGRLEVVGLRGELVGKANLSAGASTVVAQPNRMRGYRLVRFTGSGSNQRLVTSTTSVQ